METLISFSWVILGLYVLFGLIQLGPIHLKILGVIDETTVGASWGFRVVVSPGLIVLWPRVIGR